MAQQAPAAIGYLDGPGIAEFRVAQGRLDTSLWKSWAGPGQESDDAKRERASANLQVIAGPATDVLRKAGVSMPAYSVDANTRGLGGIFYPDIWSVSASLDMYAQQATSISDAWMQSKAADLYHEARHAEQYWLGAKLVAVKTGTLTTDERGFQTRVKSNVWAAARLAAGQNPVAQAASVIVAGWVTDSGRVRSIADERDRAAKAVIDEGTMISAEVSLLQSKAPVTTDAECRALLDQLKKYQLAAVQVNADYRAAFRAYLQLSLERDAYAVGAMIGEAVPDAGAVAAAHYSKYLDVPLQNLDRETQDKVHCPPPAPPP